MQNLRKASGRRQNLHWARKLSANKEGGAHTVFPGTANGKRQRSAVCKEIHKTAVFCAVGVGVLSSRSHQIAKAEKVGDTGRAYLPTYVPVEPNDYL